MSTNTTTASTTNASRATDAKLHELLTGAKCSEQRNYNGTRFFVPEQGRVGFIVELPHYTASLDAAQTAETALPAELRREYALELSKAIDTSYELLTGDPDGDENYINYTALFALITAAAAQRARALVHVLERVRGEVGT